MRASFAILAATAALLLLATLVHGFFLHSDATEREIGLAKHVVAGVCTMLFVCFVHVLAFTYFVVCARMARDAVETAGLERRALDEVNQLKRGAIRWLVAGVLPLLATGVLGAQTTPPANIRSEWHMLLALATVAINLLAFVFEFHLIGRNVILTERIYAALPARDNASAVQENAH